MRTVSRLAVMAVALIGIALVGDPVLARQSTCDAILAARDAGKSDAEIAQGFGTTQAHVVACVRIEQQRERLAAARDRFYTRRADHGLQP
jgi:uncharacterized protein (DUF433 family)